MHFENASDTRETYRFNEVTSVTGVKPYVLRFWESEFEQISPNLSEGGHKIYSNEDIYSIQKIKKLLFEDKLSIPQAKAYLDNEALEVVQSENESQVTLEENYAPSSCVTFQQSTLDMVKSALANDLKQVAPEVQQQVVVKPFNDIDVVNLVQAKKKLSIVLNKINQISSARGW